MKLIYTLFFLFGLLSSTPLCAQQATDTTAQTIVVHLERVPRKEVGWTNDFAHLLSKEQVAELDASIDHFEEETSNEICLLSIDSSWSNATGFDSLVLYTFNKWGVGKKKLNNGVVIAISKDLRRVQITNGYGVEGKLSDIETQKIIDDEMLPELRQEHYFEAFKKGLEAVMQQIR